VSAAEGGAAGRPPDLLFCRKCGGSIARRELLAGRARLLEDRAFCASCAPGSLAVRKAARAALLAGGIAAVVLLGVRTALLSSRLGETEAWAEHNSSVGVGLGARLAASERRMLDLEAEARGLRALVEAAGRGAEASRAEARAAREALEDRLEGAERSLGTVLEALEAIRREVGVLRGPQRLTDEEEAALLDRLDKANAGERFEALWTLQRGSGAAAREAAVKGLGDPEDSVRYQAAVLARELGVREARPALVRCLALPSAVVRSAAIEALRSLDGTDLGFDPLEPSESARAEAIRRWEERVR